MKGLKFDLVGGIIGDHNDKFAGRQASRAANGNIHGINGNTFSRQNNTQRELTQQQRALSFI